MKKIILTLLVLVLLLSLTSCYAERGYAYKNLNEYEPGKVHKSYTGDDPVLNDTETDGIGGVYDHLNKNLCELNPHCCGDFTPNEIWYKDMEERAIVENNEELCYSLPQEDLVVDCPNEEPYIYYSRSRCIVSFEQE